ncbi:hypothetical protein CBR_g66638 [Chara braunii]|uniref:Uncharacterized protein n=1 Tax=Chara braunii TaxID=69332 RepID=A0A388JPW8_CHABU|nr:hypothetical protein CBR_g66638 [Chara braunii]|eukprot:GBG59835.1 hypothetical protein CBR_g66638 [Chara braunii]
MLEVTTVTTKVSVTEKREEQGERSETVIVEETRERMRRGDEGEGQGEGGVVDKNVMSEETRRPGLLSEGHDNGPNARESEIQPTSHVEQSAANVRSKAGESSAPSPKTFVTARQFHRCTEMGLSGSMSSLHSVEGRLQMAVEEAFEKTLKQLRQQLADSEQQYLLLQSRLLKRKRDAEELEEEKKVSMSSVKESTDAKVKLAKELMERAKQAEQEARQAQNELNKNLREIDEDFNKQIAELDVETDEKRVEELKRMVEKLKKKLLRMETRRESVEGDIKQQMMKAIEERLRSLDESDANVSKDSQPVTSGNHIQTPSEY